jgi:hypothetical protein
LHRYYSQHKAAHSVSTVGFPDSPFHPSALSARKARGQLDISGKNIYRIAPDVNLLFYKINSP